MDLNGFNRYLRSLDQAYMIFSAKTAIVLFLLILFGSLADNFWSLQHVCGHFLYQLPNYIFFVYLILLCWEFKMCIYNNKFMTHLIMDNIIFKYLKQTKLLLNWHILDNQIILVTCIFKSLIVSLIPAVMHDLCLIHTDLKPENILLISSEFIKVPDYKVSYSYLFSLS